MKEGYFMKNILQKPKEGIDYNICGKYTFCSYCDHIPEGEVGKCGMKKMRHHTFTNDLATRNN